MPDEAKARQKLGLAEETIRKCVGRNGFYASAQLYRKQYWIRDLAYSLEPLLDLGLAYTVEKHLESTLQRQKTSGEVPERITEFPPSITGLIRLAKTLLERNPTLLVREIPTHDSDILALISVEQYGAEKPDAGLRERHAGWAKRVWSRVEANFTVDGLLPEADWRDAMLNYRGKTNFCNQVLLITAHRLAGQKERADIIRDYVNRRFWDDEMGHYHDYPGSRRFDALGHSLALLEGVAPKKRIEDVVRAFQGVSTRFGLRNIWPAYRERECGQSLGYYQNSTVWPFIQGYAVEALVRVGRRDLAEEEFGRFTDLAGFSEWYSPSTGQPGGSAGQLWSAAGYVRAHRSLADE